MKQTTNRIYHVKIAYGNQRNELNKTIFVNAANPTEARLSVVRNWKDNNILYIKVL